ncbi:hypothetical protein NQ318_001776 [Aromia moschata]|uniref:Uncharacterized protein n=1 Tax=Aromia moschata TaxID=1265417 RepID=A0AAV8XIE3_9CUCU|nr:hypothetical protein NQ318_001776 [Aromia moschata]
MEISKDIVHRTFKEQLLDPYHKTPVQDLLIQDTGSPYRDCRDIDDPCLEKYCPADEECYVYQPENCGGCGPIVDCRSAPPAPEETTTRPTNAPVSEGNMPNHQTIIVNYVSTSGSSLFT